MLPVVLKGKWIWCGNEAEKVESYCFFRREFTLDETPASADLWLTARTKFHLFINGRHVAYGPRPSPVKGAMVLSVDASFFLETGRNVIAVLVHNTSVSRESRKRQKAGFWCQLDLDGKPWMWSDEEWRCKPADCYEKGRPRQGPTEDFVERVDMRLYPHGWQREYFDEFGWQAPDMTEPLSTRNGNLMSTTLPDFAMVRHEFQRLTVHGHAQKGKAMSYLSFKEMVNERGPGVYAGETFLYSDEAQSIALMLYSENPYRLYLNGELLREQGVPVPRSNIDPEKQVPLCMAQAELINPAGFMTVSEGWNLVQVFQQVTEESSGFTIIFPDFLMDELGLYRRKAENSTEGWTASGPLRTPLSQVRENIRLQELPHASYTPELSNAVSEAASLSSFSFEPLTLDKEPVAEYHLRDNEYIVLDLGRTMTGCPEIQIFGNEGDIVDLITSEHLDNNAVRFFTGHRQNVETIVCGTEQCRWIAAHPRGMRYLMILVRQSLGTVTITDAGLRSVEFSFSNTGEFECEDEDFTRIWETGLNTLRNTVQFNFVVAPAGDAIQRLPDAMLQSFAAYHTMGAFELAAGSIRDFAQSQYETGEILPVTPSDKYRSIPDFSLLWPVWLLQHFQYAGDRSFVDEMMPSVQRFFEYFDSVGGESNVLYDLDVRLGARCVLDFDERIDRKGISTGLNAIYCRSLFSGARLFETVGNSAAAALLRERAASVAQKVRALTWQPEKGLFADAWNDGAISGSASWQTNVLAIYGGLAPAEEYEPIFKTLFDSESRYRASALTPGTNPYFMYFVLETALALRKRSWAMELIREYWGGMLQHGATTWWESFNPAAPAPPNGSLCHGYGTFVNGLLCTELAGIRPARPGFAAAVFNPIIGVASWVRAQIPTVHGHINVEWSFEEDAGLVAYVDANYPLEIIPVFDPQVAAQATLHVSDDVTILVDELL